MATCEEGAGKLAGMIVLAALLLLQPNTVLCRLDSQQVNESSGLAASVKCPGEFYTHNDSGDSARIFRFDLSGKVTATISLEGTKAIDWEDMEISVVGGKSVVFIGDIGDNAKRRGSVQVYRFPEPGRGVQKVTKLDTLDLKYPDGPRDCEALLVAPKTGKIWLITKEEIGKFGIYSLMYPNKSGSYVLTKEAFVERQILDKVTAGSISPDGKWLAFRTYVSIQVYPYAEKWWTQKPRIMPSPKEEQGEAIAFDLKSERLLTTSEGAPCPISQSAWVPPAR